MNATQARTFERTSPAHIEHLANVAAARGCTCQAYVDWFTYRRWQALGFQVQRGEKSTRLPNFITDQLEDPDTGKKETIRRKTTSCLFCRCQVQPKEAAE